MAISAKDVKPTGLDGISQRQIDAHFDVLYKGYVNKYNEIQQRMQDVNPSEANATDSPIRELKLEETFAADAVRLHEAYFENLGGGGQVASGPIVDLIKEDWGSFEKWEAEFRGMGLSARGWVVLAFDWQTRRLHNFLSDAHNVGAMWNCTPVLVLDVYEHAYFIDYGTNRKSYLEAFMRNINWDVVNRRITSMHLDQSHASRAGQPVAGPL